MIEEEFGLVSVVRKPKGTGVRKKWVIISGTLSGACILCLCLCVCIGLALGIGSVMLIREARGQRCKMDGDLEKIDIEVGGLSRQYFLHAADYASGPVPLVMMLHGGGGLGDKGAAVDAVPHWMTYSNGSFTLVFPNAYGDEWNDGRNFGSDASANINDVEFLKQVVQDVQNRGHAIDPRRILVTGISNGAMMSIRLWCDASDVFTHVAPVAGLMPKPIFENRTCNPTRARPISIMSGTDDPLVPYNGGSVGYSFLSPRGEVISFNETVSYISSLAMCSPHPSQEVLPQLHDDGTTVTRTQFSNCSLTAYSIQGGGHTWPDGCQYLPSILIGKTTQNLDATSTIFAMMMS